MWWVKENHDHSRGGFQNRDVGKTTFDRDMGPDFGVDYARLSDPEIPGADEKLHQSVTKLLTATTSVPFELKVHNGFVFLKGEFEDALRESLKKLVHEIEHVRDVIITTTPRRS